MLKNSGTQEKRKTHIMEYANDAVRFIRGGKTKKLEVYTK